MALVLKQTRPCDGVCCQEAPRFPTDETHSQCIYFDDSLDTGDFPGRCKLMADRSLQRELSKTDADPTGPNPTRMSMSSKDWFVETCVKWPENTRPERDLGGCCFHWVEDGD